MAAVVNWQISVFHIFPFFAPCIAIFSTMRYPSATSSTIITLKPTAKNTVPTLECCPCDISGISSSTTTYSMAPATKRAPQCLPPGSSVLPRSHRECTIESAFSFSPSSSFLPPIAVHDSAFHLGNFQLLRKSNGQYRRQLPLPQPRSAPVCFAFSAPASMSARTAHLQALAAPKTGCARPIACRLQRRHRYS